MKSHYWFFVLVCLIAAVIGTDFNSSLNAFRVSSGTEVPGKVSEGASGSPEDSIYTVIGAFMNGSAVDLLNATGVSETKEFRSAFATTNGVLASIVHNFSGGNIIVDISRALRSLTGGDQSLAEQIATVLASVVSLLWLVFVINIFQVIISRISIEARIYRIVPASRAVFTYRAGKTRKTAWTMFVMHVYSMLWGLTIVGGFIKYYSYRLVPFIVAENPDLSANEAITLSRKMMNGWKKKALLLDLSFIGWEILSLLTFGVLKIFFLNGYQLAARAEFYAAVRSSARERNIEGIQSLGDRWLFEKAPEELIRENYADVIPMIGAPEPELPGLSRGLRILADNFGIILLSSKQEVEYEKAFEDRQRIRTLIFEAERESYPTRLCLVPPKKRRVRTDNIHYMRHYSIPSLAFMYLFVSFVGWCWEVTLHLMQTGQFVNRGVLHGPWLPIYGTGCVVVLPLLHRFKKKPVVLFFLTVVLCGVLEYFTGYYLEKTHGMSYWSYKGYFMNLHGRICAEGLFVFGAAGLLVTYVVAPMVDNLVRSIPLKVMIPIVTALFVVFMGDQIYSSHHPNTDIGEDENYAAASAEAVPGSPESAAEAAASMAAAEPPGAEVPAA